MRFKALRQFIHVIVAIFFWIVFVVYWRIVMLRPMGSGTRMALLTIALATIVTAVYVVVWVRYNVVQADRLPQRTSRRKIGSPEARDFLGRKSLVKSPARLRRARHVEIDIQKRTSSKRTLEHKTYSVRSGGNTTQWSTQ